MKAKFLTAAILTTAFAAGSVFAQSNYTEKDLVWKDDFDKLNMKDWSFEKHEPGWVNNELQEYGTSSANTYVKDGKLVIQAIQKENKDGSYSYTSGRINTQGKKEFLYGRFEARIKFPKGQGFLPAFWMMPAEQEFYGQWPKCGEIDIAEVLGHETNTLYGTIHYGEPHAQQQGIYTLPAGSKDFYEDFHVFAIEWEPGEMRYYCDGVLYNTIHNWFTKRPGFDEITYPAPFDQPFYIILNLAVGGSWPGNPDDTTTFDEKAQMLVDYVKVYQKKSYDENVPRPTGDTIVLDTDASGNLVKTGASAWKFLSAGTGAGALSVSGGNLTITSKDAGEYDYSVQVVQPKMPMEMGKVYKYSFDAKADANRTIITGITAPNQNYVRMFGDEKIRLTPKMQHFEYTFNMLDNSDADCRIEYNLGNQDSTATVYVSNVRLEQIGDVDWSKLNAGALPDGNVVHNGAFQEGEGRLGKWQFKNDVGSNIFVTNEVGSRRIRQLKIENKKSKKSTDVQVYQDKLILPAGKECILRFEASSTKTTRDFSVSIGDKQYDVGMLMKNLKKYEVAFVADDYGPEGTTLTFNVGVPGATVTLDNVSLKENISVMNGEFDKELRSWEVYTHGDAKSSYKIDKEGDNNIFTITINDTSATDWKIQLKQQPVLVEKGKKYKITLRAKSDLPRDIMWALQRDGSKDEKTNPNAWDPYSGTIKNTLSTEWQTFTNTFAMGKDTDENVIFTISMGAVNGKQIKQEHTICIDSISVEQVK